MRMKSLKEMPDKKLMEEIEWASMLIRDLVNEMRLRYRKEEREEAKFGGRK